MKTKLTFCAMCASLVFASTQSLFGQVYYGPYPNMQYQQPMNQQYYQQPQERPLLNLLANAAGAYAAVQQDLNIQNQQAMMQRMQQAQWDAQVRLAQQQAQFQAQQQAWMAQQQQMQQAAWQAQQEAQLQHQNMPNPLMQRERVTPDYRAIGNGIQMATGVDVNGRHRAIKKEWDELRDQVSLETPNSFKKLAKKFGW